jgi:hypothetical protein
LPSATADDGDFHIDLGTRLDFGLDLLSNDEPPPPAGGHIPAGELRGRERKPS